MVIAWGCFIFYSLWLTFPGCVFLLGRVGAGLTPSLPCGHLKTTNKNAKFETLKPFLLVFLHWHMKEFSSKRITLKVDCYRSGKYTVCRRVRASFSPERD